MFTLLNSIDSALHCRKGVTALEYAIIAAATIATGMVSFGLIGTSLSGVFNQFKTALAQ